MPSEHVETCIFAQWLRSRDYLFYKSPSETFTSSWNAKRKNKMEGVTKGYPDFCILLRRKSILFIELKKEKGKRGGMNGSVISPEQEVWIESLSKIDNVDACICHGAEEAKKMVLYFEEK